jgi:hypothetical protein
MNLPAICTMRSLKATLTALAAAVPVTAAGGMFVGLTALQLEAQSNAHAFQIPKGIVLEVESFTIDRKTGARKPSTEEIIAVREDGAKSTWIKHARFAHLGFSHKLLDFPLTGQRVTIDRVAGTLSTTRDTAAQVKARAEYVASGKFGQCMGNPSPQTRLVRTRTIEAQESMHGMSTLRSKTVYSGSNRIEIDWISPEYNCLLVQSHMIEGDHEFRRQAKSIKFGPPDPSFFEVPTDLKESNPPAAP